jgi:N-acyl amino acid synthase FeeM
MLAGMTPGDRPAFALQPASGSLAQAYRLRRAESARDWEEVESLRHAGLASRGEILPSAPSSMRDEIDSAPNTITFVLAAEGQALGTTRSSVTSALRRAPLPAQRVFSREIVAAFGADATVVEASLTFVDVLLAHDPRDALFRLFKAHMLHCAAVEADALVVTARLPQLGFYRRSLNMEILSGAEAWPGMATPRVLMGVALRQHAPALLRRLPVFGATPEEERAFAGLQGSSASAGP